MSAAHLRALLATGRTLRLAGAHNALGARIAARAGFDGIWASSLEACASRGIPDTAVISLNECLAAATALANAVSLPVVADCDTGFGDAAAAAEMARRFEAAGVAAVCIEDQPSAKTNSLAEGPHTIVPVDVFTAKIRGAKSAQRHVEFMLIARTEALIAGLGVREVLIRAHAYADAGADAVLVHSKARTSAPIAESLSLWNRRVPIVVVPTTYPDCTAGEFGRMGAQVVIYANHGMRAAIRAMEEAFATILRDGCTRRLETQIASVHDIFELQVEAGAAASDIDRCA
jgi:phosphoenolpyruvate phosphomutase